ncbi:MAG: hypothetical protein JWN78_2484 [Bacteroidota bacterium]|nr:hypothetical protein [Bacteroidota bacterium]
MNKVINQVVKNKEKISQLKNKINKIDSSNLKMSFLNTKPKIIIDKTFSDASEFWSSHDNHRD